MGSATAMPERLDGLVELVHQRKTGQYEPHTFRLLQREAHIFDKMLDEANNTVDLQKRFEILAQAELYVMQQQIIIPLGTNTTSWMKKPYIKGFYPNPGTLEPWKFAYIERDPAKWTTNMNTIMKEDDPVVTEQIKQLMATQEQMEKSKAAETGKVNAVSGE